MKCLNHHKNVILDYLLIYYSLCPQPSASGLYPPLGLTSRRCRSMTFDDDDDDDFFLRNGWSTKGVHPLFPARTIVRDSHYRKSPAHQKSEFRLCWMKFCSNDNHYITAPRIVRLLTNCQNCQVANKCIDKTFTMNNL